MVRFSEWLPNPAGSDAAGEWIELWNDGPERESLAGWVIGTSAGKQHTIQGLFLGPGERRVLPRAETGLVLRNENERIALFDREGAFVAESSFFGAAPEGKSVNVNRSGSSYFFGAPTPGAGNAEPAEAVIHSAPPGALRANLGFGDAALIAIGAAALLTFFAVAAIKRDAHLSDTLFGRN